MDNALKTIAKNDGEIVVGNYIILFGGRDTTGANIRGYNTGGKNKDGTVGEYFTERTNVKSAYTEIGVFPVDWEHGFQEKRGEPGREALGYVDWKSATRDSKGWFVNRVLNRRNEFIAALDEAGVFDSGLIGNSSEADPMRAVVMNNGEIVEWPLIKDTLTVQPFDPRMLGENAIRARKALEDLGLVIEQQPENEKEAVSVADEPINEVPIIKSSKETTIMSENTEVKEVEAVAVDVSAIAKQAAQEAVKAYQDALPVKSAGVAVIGDEADRKLEGNPFTAGEFYQEVRKAAEGRNYDDRLKPLKSEIPSEGIMYTLPIPAVKAMKAPSGLSQVVPSDGGFLVGVDRRDGVMMRDYATGQVWNRAQNIPIGPNSNGMTMNVLKETSRVNGSRWGGVLGYWLAEADEKTSSKPTFDQIEAKLKKVAALVYATDELLADATALAGVINSVVPAELAFQKDDKAINGSGVGVPLGILQAPALVTVAKEANQAADTVVSQNIINMWARRWARGSYVWFINQDVEPQLHQLNLPVGTGGALVYMPPGGLSGLPYGTLYGSPVITIEQAATVGDVGDIILADMGQYLTISKGGVQSAESIHVRFVYDESVFRFVERVDGMPLWKAALTPFKGTNTQSPFVTLAARA